MLIKYNLFKSKLPMLSSALNAYSLREKTIAKNIANVTTPGYQPEKVKFEELFEKEKSNNGILMTDTNHFSPMSASNEVKAEVVKRDIEPGEELFEGQNSVNIDKEMTALAENQIKMRFASRMTKRYFAGLNSAITGMRE